MKTKIVMTAAVILFAAGTDLTAQDAASNTNAMPALAAASMGAPPARVLSLYRANEFSLDAYGLGTVNQWTLDHFTGRRVDHHGRLGAGAGLEYFITRYVGVEAEGFSESTHHSFVNDFGGNLMLRLPVGETGLAPYIFGGGGHHFEPVDGTYADGGAGLEYRFNPHFGLFTDGRFVTTSKISNYGMGRLGLRFSF